MLKNIRVIYKYIFFIWLTAITVSFSQQNNNDFVEGELYVKLKAQFNRQAAGKNSSNVNTKREIPGIKNVIERGNAKINNAKAPFYYSKNDKLKSIYRIKVENYASIEEILDDLKNHPSIEYAERVRMRKIISTPSDTLYTSLWHLAKIKASEAWDINPGVQNVIVAVVDNAFDIDHLDLNLNMVPGYDVGDNDANPRPLNDTYSHGTHVAGIVGAINNNITGIASASNNRVKVMPIKGNADIYGNKAISHGFEGISYAVGQGVKIISLSWGGGGYSLSEQAIIDDAHANGAIIFAAAGNEGNSDLQYPAAYNHVVAVASLDNTDALSSFSSFGSFVDISAPGRAILSTIPFNKYASFSGTSMATPLAASCAGYLLACFPTLNADSIEYILKNTVDNIDATNPSFSGSFGSGRINLLKAISCKDSDLITQTPSASPTNYFCEGDSALLSITALSTETFSWNFNNTFLSNSKDINAKNEGTYTLTRTLGACQVTSEPVYIIHNNAFTDIPTVTNLTTSYCDDVNKFVVGSNVACNKFGQSTFNYGGSPIGFDGFLQSAPYPTATVSGIGGLIDSIAVSITWHKKDGGNENQCDLADFGARAFNEEVSFSIKSPFGKIVDLVRTGDYATGIITSGVVTTIFNANGSTLTGIQIPSSGNFKAAGDLSIYENEVAQGEWTLIANDAATLDPLCVIDFAVIVKTKQISPTAEISWYSDPSLNNLLGTNDSLEINTSVLGSSSYYAVAQCDGLCPSTATPSEVNITAVPEIFAFSRSVVSLSNAQILEVMNSQTAEYSVSTTNLYTVFGLNAGGNPYSYQVSNQAPLSSPVVICGTDDYVVFGRGCNGTITWSTGMTAPGIMLNNQNASLNITATCNQSWTCPPLTNIPFDFTTSGIPQTLSGMLIQSSGQNFYGSTIESSHVIKENTRINYSAIQSILLTPGFESVQTSIFKAVIGDCINP
jgi:serine protease